MNNLVTTLLAIFSGKGGTLKLTIFCSILAALGYEIMENGYSVSVNNQNGAVSLTPSGKTSPQEEDTEEPENESNTEAEDLEKEEE